jgi:hypothetical protein
MKRIELFEKFFTVKPQPIGDYIFHKYISNIYGDVKTYTMDYPPAIGIPKYSVDIEFRINFPLKETDFKKILEIIDSVKPLCYDKIKKSDGVSFYIYESLLRIRLILKKDKVKEIEQSQEYKDWLISVDTQWKKYREDENLKKHAKKYNL